MQHSSVILTLKRITLTSDALTKFRLYERTPDISFESKSNEIRKSPCKNVQKRRLSPETPRNDTKRSKRFSILKEINCRTVS
jgi:hypothetical protein